MEFYDRKISDRIKVVTDTGELFAAVFEPDPAGGNEEVTGTRLNASVFNAIYETMETQTSSVMQRIAVMETSISEKTEKINSNIVKTYGLLQSMYSLLFDYIYEPLSAKEYDDLNLTAAEYEVLEDSKGERCTVDFYEKYSRLLKKK